RTPRSRRRDSSARTRDTTYGSTLAWYLPMVVPRSGGVEVPFPEVQVDRDPRFGEGPPQLGPLEADAVEMLRRFAEPVSVRVGEHPGPLGSGDDAPPAPGVARKPRVAG